MPINFRVFLISPLINANNLSLLSYNVSLRVLYATSLNHDCLSILVLSHLFLSSNYVSILILNDLDIFPDFLVSLPIILNCLYSLFFLANLSCLLIVLYLSNLSRRLYYISWWIFNNIFFYYCFNSLLLYNILLVFKHWSIFSSLDLYCVFLLSKDNSIGIHDFISIYHDNFSILLYDLWFVLMHISLLVSLNLNNISLNS